MFLFSLRCSGVRLLFLTIVLLSISFLGLPDSLYSQAEKRWLEEVSNPKTLGEELLKEGLFEQAREMLEQAELRYPGDPDVRRYLSETYFRLAEDRFSRGSYLEAEYFAEESLKRQPRRPLLWLLLGRIRLNLKNPRGSLDALSEAARQKAPGVDPYLVESHGLVALEAIQRGDLAQAEISLTEARKRGPNEALVMYGYGRYYFARSEYDRAVSYFEASLGSERFLASSLYFLGRSYAALKRWERALEFQERAVTYPDFHSDSLRLRAEIQYGWGKELYQKQAYSEVPAHLHDALSLLPDWYEARTLLARTYLILGEGEKAKSVLEPLYATRSAIPEVRNLMAEAEITIGRSLVEVGKLKEAVEAFQRALIVEPNYGAAWMPLGRTYESLKLYEKAVDAYRRSIAFGLETLEANERAMRILMDKIHRPLEAWDHAEAVLKILPSHSEAQTRIIKITHTEGMKAFRNKDYTLAKRLFLRHRQLKEDTQEVNSSLAEIYIQENAFRLALPLVEGLLQVNKEDDLYRNQGYRVFVGIATEAEANEDYREAEEFLSRALKIQPQEHSLWFRIAVAKLKLEKYSESVEIFHRLEDEVPSLREKLKPYLALALVGYARTVMAKNPTQAVTLSEEAIQKNPAELSAYPVAASAYVLIANYPRAIEVLEIYLKEVPRDIEEWQHLLTYYRSYITLLAQEKQEQKLITYAERLRRYAPDDPLALFHEGMAYIRLGQFERAEPLLHKVREIRPYAAHAQLELARGYAKKKEFLRATTYYRGARRFDPFLTPVTEEVEIFRKAAAIMEKQHNLTEANQLYAYIVPLVPEDPQANYDYGRTLRSLAKQGDAHPYLKKAHELKPLDLAYASEYARNLLDLGQARAGTKILLELARNNPTSFPLGDLLLVSLVAAVYESLSVKEWEDTIHFSDEGIARDRTNPFFHWAKGKSLQALMRLEEAERSYESAFELAPTNPVILREFAALKRALGDRYRKDQLWTQAETAYTRSLTLEENREAYEGLVLIAMGKGEEKQAYYWLKGLEKWGKLTSPWILYKGEVLRSLGARALELKNYPEAISYFQEYHKDFPSEWEPRYYLGLVLLRSGDPVAALSILRGIETWKPPHPLVPTPRDLLHETLRQILIEDRSDPPDRNRGELIEEALDLFPEDPDFWVVRARIWEKQGKWKKAAQALDRALNLDPHHKEARVFLEEILAEHAELRSELTLPPGVLEVPQGSTPSP